MASHLFLVRGDITRLWCDHWLLPAGDTARLSSAFRKGLVEACGVDEERDLPLGPRLPGWPGDRVVPWPDYRADLPLPWVTFVGGTRSTKVEWFLEAVRLFLDRVEGHLARRIGSREKPLVALPAVGTGGGGGRERKGEIVGPLVDLLLEEAEKRPFDLALVCYRAQDFAAASKRRRDVAGGWPDLPAELQEEARRLADRARRQELVLFMGAGTGASVGLPTWKELLGRLATTVGFAPDEVRELEALSVLDQAVVVARRYERVGGAVAMAEEIARLLSRRHHGLVHSLLAGLRVRESVTLNYDRLYEEACELDRRLAVLPYQSPLEADAWLLKLHGCISEPQDIVLGRPDYLRFEDRRKALAGVVHALLLTRHTLFVGFSLTDDNFLKIVDEVLKAAGDKVVELGTALMVHESRLLRELWGPRLRLLSTETSEGDGAAARRRLEIFLDLLLSEATTVTDHLLDPTFAAILDGGERDLRDGLLRLRDDASPAARESAAWGQVRDLMRRLGAAVD